MQYWTLPENVRKAIDIAKLKRKNTDFYYRLKKLNDKIHIFTSIFYSKIPKYQKDYYYKKKKTLEKELELKIIE